MQKDRTASPGGGGKEVREGSGGSNTGARWGAQLEVQSDSK